MCVCSGIELHKTSREKLHMNNTNIDEHHPIFDELHKIHDASTSHNSHPSPPTVMKHINTDETTPHTHITVKHRNIAHNTDGVIKRKK
jgi:hypothetical protein